MPRQPQPPQERRSHRWRFCGISPFFLFLFFSCTVHSLAFVSVYFLFSCPYASLLCPTSPLLLYSIPPHSRSSPTPFFSSSLSSSFFILQGVIWGKDPKHFVGRTAWLKAAASVAGVTLHSTLSTRDAPASLRNLPNIVFHGHLTRPAWQKLLAESS